MGAQNKVHYEHEKRWGEEAGHATLEGARLSAPAPLLEKGGSAQHEGHSRVLAWATWTI